MSPATHPSAERRIRSFVRRQGRLTPGQERALERLWPHFGVAADGPPLDLEVLFGRRAPRVLEIGFGSGESLATLAERHPEQDYLGIEVHRPGVGRLLLEVERRGLSNVRVACGDAVEVVRERLPTQSLDAVYLFFPDPWHKKRHHKRRLVEPAFVALVRSRLAAGGQLYMVTDWEDYAQQMQAVMAAAPGWQNCYGEGFAPRQPWRPRTRFEQRGERLGHAVWELLYRRCE